MLTRKGKFSLVLPALFLVQSMAWAESDTADSVGRVKFANGNVKIVSSGSEQLARKGSLLKEGDTIVTDIGGSAQLDMKDKGIISVRPDSQLQIVTYKTNSDSNGGRAIFSLLKGAFRSITGLIGKRTPENYAVETPTATIGVRGTDHEPQFVPPDGWSGAPGRPAGTYDTVYSGKTVISTKGGKIEVAPGQTGYAPRQDSAPVLQLSMSGKMDAKQLADALNLNLDNSKNTFIPTAAEIATAQQLTNMVMQKLGIQMTPEQALALSTSQRRLDELFSTPESRNTYAYLSYKYMNYLTTAEYMAMLNYLSRTGPPLTRPNQVADVKKNGDGTLSLYLKDINGSPLPAPVVIKP